MPDALALPHLKFHTALLTAAYASAHKGVITHDDLKATIECTADPTCDTCMACQTITISAAVDNGLLTSEQAHNPNAVNWANLLAFIEAIITIIMQLINPPKPTPTPPAP